MKKKENYLIAFLMTTLIFVVGIMVGSEITKQRTEMLEQRLQGDILEIQSLELELALIERVGTENLCDYISSRMPDIAKKKVELGRLFDTGNIPENRAKLLESQFAESLIRFYLLSQIEEDKCKSNKPKVMFFLDNGELSREQARVLDNIVFRLSDENITVFAFNENLAKTQPLIRLMFKFNNVTTMPTIFINNTKYEGFQTKESVVRILCASYENLPIC